VAPASGGRFVEVRSTRKYARVFTARRTEQRWFRRCNSLSFVCKLRTACSRAESTDDFVEYIHIASQTYHFSKPETASLHPDMNLKLQVFQKSRSRSSVHVCSCYPLPHPRKHGTIRVVECVFEGFVEGQRVSVLLEIMAHSC